MVEEAIAKLTPINEQWVILDQYTIEKPWGWIFFYDSGEYVKTGDGKFQLVGNAPYIVNKETHELVATGTAEDIEVYIADYEATFRRL
jgi:hypothetical protein